MRELDDRIKEFERYSQTRFSRRNLFKGAGIAVATSLVKKVKGYLSMGGNDAYAQAPPDIQAAQDKELEKLLIGFIRREGDVANLYAMSANGTNLRKLIEGVSHEGTFAWSPDGNKIAYSSGNIWVIDYDGKNPINVTKNFPSDKRISTLPHTWSPDGKYILFTALDGLWRADLSNINGSDGNGITYERLADAVVGAQPLRPKYSPDGKSIAFEFKNQIWTIDANGKSQRQMTKEGRNDAPSWSPDGKWIAFEYRKDRNALFKDTEIGIVSLLGTDKIILTNNDAPDILPQWSPDGQSIYFASNRSGKWAIWVMDRDSKNPRRLTDPDIFELFEDYKLSPDGRWLAYPVNVGGIPFIYVSKSDGANPVKVAQGYRQEWRPKSTIQPPQDTTPPTIALYPTKDTYVSIAIPTVFLGEISGHPNLTLEKIMLNNADVTGGAVINKTPGHIKFRYEPKDLLPVGDNYLSVEVLNGENKAVAINKTRVIAIPDYNKDGEVNIFELVLTADKFGEIVSPNTLVDSNRDGVVNIFDFVIVANYFGERISEIPSAAPQREISLKERRQYISAIKDAVDNSPTPTEEYIQAKKSMYSFIHNRLIKPYSDTEKPAVVFQNFPNKFNPETWIPYRVNQHGNYAVTIFDGNGRMVKRFDLGYKEAGDYITKGTAVSWNGTNDLGERLSSGVYRAYISGNKKGIKLLLEK